VLLVVLLAGHAFVSLRAQRSGSARLRRVLDPFHSFVLGAILVGLALPISLVVDDGITALGSTRATLMGSGVNQGVKPFDLNGIDFGAWPLREALVVFVLAGVAAAYGLWKRELFPVLWFAGAAALGVMASARLGVTRYYAPPFVVSVPAALWLLKRFRLPGAVAAAALALFVVVPQIQHRNGPANDAKKMEAVNRLVAIQVRMLPPKSALLVPDGAPVPDGLYFSVVQPYLADHPVYPYRALPDTPAGRTYAGVHGIALQQSALTYLTP
jgi:hypothetical protein